MAQTSRFWATSATPSGDQQASYSGADFADVWRAMGEGVISGHSLPALDGELACSDGGANTVDVADGAAIVDGIYFESTAVENVNVPSAVGAGYTRIDRIVVRVTWASYDAAITRIAGTDAASPSAPSITQTTETTYDIKLCQVLVDTSGNVTVTDERTQFGPRIYVGRASAGGTAVRMPAGWTIAHVTTGQDTITHNLGHTNYTVVANPVSFSGTVSIYEIAANTFNIIQRDGTGSTANISWTFILIVYD